MLIFPFSFFSSLQSLRQCWCLQQIQVKFLDFKLSKPNDCDVNFLDIFPEQTVMPLRWVLNTQNNIYAI